MTTGVFVPLPTIVCPECRGRQRICGTKCHVCKLGFVELSKEQWRVLEWLSLPVEERAFSMKRIQQSTKRALERRSLLRNIGVWTVTDAGQKVLAAAKGMR